MTFVVNVHRELCTLSKAGGIPITTGQILNCANIAAIKATEITEIIKAALAAVSGGNEGGAKEIEKKKSR
ncbi:hypothetical protein BDK51DRAFT_51509 [Blyttiomyces helicus]|uniref:Uncharacterized protein n=1 Tax=Blyttiomyces helicus TaxID=388810 RepID=A0A4P9WBH1_9FUNG|nr:hypothetical protein BDK51DRAFT_51509 [Blyttiomyces helicus]|eukprot:RKO87636.1 hypothetical protein BDK51DRAFT_51509 [Blyttiomyces helicus]